MEAATGLSRSELLTAAPIPEDLAEKALGLAERRAAGEPLQYVTGSAGFRHLDLQVGPGVFIPRPETESLVDRALARLPKAGIVVDLCSGSGAVALAVADERADATVIATELSEEALGWAERNKAALDVPVHFIHGDLFENLPPSLEGKVGVVVSNPPYVATAEAGSLPDEVVHHEPSEALFSGRDGLQVIERISAGAGRWLRPGGWLVIEIGDGQRDEVTRLLERAGWADVEVYPDLLGRARVAEARWGP